jgi:hypothetical protein
MAYEAITDDERADPPVAGFMELGDEPKGWDRASISMKTHPLHAFPNVSQADFILPSAANKVRLVADCLTMGAAFALLIYFPLMMIGFMSTSDQTGWILGTMLTAGLGTAILVFIVALADERAFRAELEP